MLGSLLSLGTKIYSVVKEKEITTATIEQSKSFSTGKTIAAGTLAGLAGGMLFGMMMAMMGMLPMIGMLVRQESSLVGFIVHMMISAGLGAIYGLVAGRLPLTTSYALLGGIAYGVIWWVLGALIMMPLMLGMNQMVLVIGTDQWLSLVGHMVYGVVTALVFIPLVKRL